MVTCQGNSMVVLSLCIKIRPTQMCGIKTASDSKNHPPSLAPQVFSLGIVCQDEFNVTHETVGLVTLCPNSRDLAGGEDSPTELDDLDRVA